MNRTQINDITILIAEDETKLLYSMAEYLQLFFAHVHTAQNGKEAFALYEREHPDIVIADIHMPELDGLSLIEKIRKTDQETKIIITTAYSDREKLLQAIELHLVKYLIKPVQSDMLKKLLFSLVDTIRSSRSLIPLKEGFYWDRRNKLLLSHNQEIVLKPKEKKVLSYLIEHAGESVSSIDIYNILYEDQPERDYSAHAVTSMIKRLRQKLPKESLKSSYGVGYIFYTK